MTFQDTYREEVLKSRRTRSQRALFWSKVIGFALMITVAATLRSEPQLRIAILNMGMDGVAVLRGEPTSKPETQFTKAANQPQIPDISKLLDPSQSADLSKMFDPSQMPDLSQLQAMFSGASAPQEAAPTPSRPRDAVRVNRFGSGQTTSVSFRSVQSTGGAASSPNDRTKAAAIDLNRLLTSMKPGQ